MKKVTVNFRRKKEGKTDYRQRLKLLASGKPRLSIRKSNKQLFAQLIRFMPTGDVVITAAHTSELRRYGWSHATRNIPAAYLVGLLVAQKARKAGVTEAIADLGLYRSTKGNILYAAIKGCIDNGLAIRCSDRYLPSEDRISGKHIAANKVTKYTKSRPADITELFNKVKEALKKNG